MRALQGGLLVVVVAALAACTATPAPTTSPTTEASATPSDPPATRPALVLDGDCDALLTPGEVGAATGGELELAAPTDDVLHAGVAQLGGLWCAWRVDDGWQVWVTVVPAAAIPADVIADAATPYCYGGDVAAGDQDACSFGAVFGDLWFAGVVYTAAASGIRGTDAIDELSAIVAPRLEGVAAPAAYRPDGSWAVGLDCSVFEGVDVAPYFGAAIAPQPSDGPGEMGPGVYPAARAAGFVGCSWFGDGVSADVVVLPAGAWTIEAGAVDATGDVLYSTAGVNLIGLWAPTLTDQQRSELLATLVAALDGA